MSPLVISLLISTCPALQPEDSLKQTLQSAESNCTPAEQKNMNDLLNDLRQNFGSNSNILTVDPRDATFGTQDDFSK